MTVVDADIEEIVAAVWASLFEVPLEAGHGPGIPVDGPMVTGCVQVEGAWQGAVLLRCPLPLASTLAEAMFQAGEPATADICDALGELTNMVAGNVKAHLPEPSSISIPAVAVGRDYRFGVLGTAVVSETAFSCAGHDLAVTVLQRTTVAPR